jgi:hypothetical protein
MSFNPIKRFDFYMSTSDINIKFHFYWPYYSGLGPVVASFKRDDQFEFHKKRAICWPDERLLAFKGKFSFTELITFKATKILTYTGSFPAMWRKVFYVPKKKHFLPHIYSATIAYVQVTFKNDEREINEIDSRLFTLRIDDEALTAGVSLPWQAVLELLDR